MTTESTRPVLTPAVHEARAYMADDVFRTLSLRYTARSFTQQFADGATPDELAELRAARDSYARLAAAHRQAARRLARIRRIKRVLGWS